MKSTNVKTKKRKKNRRKTARRTYICYKILQDGDTCSGSLSAGKLCLNCEYYVNI
jgi:hypothetical protein